MPASSPMVSMPPRCDPSRTLLRSDLSVWTQSGSSSRGSNRILKILPVAVRLGAIALVCLLLSLAFTSSSSAQTAPEAAPAEAIPAERVQSLLDTLENEEARQELIENLRTLLDVTEPVPGEAAAPPESGGAALIAILSDRINAVTLQLSRGAAALADLPSLWSSVWQRLESADSDWGGLAVVAKIAAVLAAGLLAEFLAVRILARPRRVLEDRAAGHVGIRVLFLIFRTLLDLVPIVAFAAASYAVLPMTDPDRITRLLSLVVINANVVVRAVLAFVRMLLTPNVSTLRLLPLTNETANYLYIWVRRIAIVGVYGYFFAEVALLLGVPFSAHQVLIKLLGLVIAAMLIVLVLQSRQPVSAVLRDDGTGAPALRTVRNRLADVWHVLAILYIVAVYAVMALNVRGGFEFLLKATVATIVIAILARIVATVLVRLLDRVFQLSDEVKTQYPSLEARANRYLPVLHRIVRGAIYAVAVLMILDVWGMGIFEWMSSEAGRAVVGAALSIALILVAALVTWEVLSAIIERSLRRQQAAQAPGRGARLITLLPLLRNAVRIVLVVMVTLIVLAEIGIDIAPLLAGAGVIGLAIGFGAQTLVKDVITGAFVLVEDSIGIGDFVEVGGHAGIVEGMSIRTIRLRDLAGDVHVVPFGDVSTVKNSSREFAFAVMDIGVAYRENVDDVIEVLREIGEMVREDATAGPNILEPLNIMGLQDFGDSAVVVRVRFKTVPGMQFAVRRVFNLYVKRVFDERGIEIPFPHQTIYFGEDRKGNAPPAHVVLEGRRGGSDPLAIGSSEEETAGTDTRAGKDAG